MADNAGSDPSDGESDPSDHESDTFSDDDSDTSGSDDDFDPLELFVYRGKGSIPRNVTRIEVDRSVRFIPDLLFACCRQLESVLLHEGLLHIGDSAFHECSSLRSFRCPSTATKIGVGAFSGCSNLTAFELPKGLKCIEASTFCGCTSLREVQIPASVAWIGYSVFAGCTNLASLELCEGLRKIMWMAFSGCSSLESLSVPSSVDEIHEEAFDRCSSLTLVRLHENLPRMRRFAFRGCPLESFQFVHLSKRREAIRMDDQIKSMFDGRLREITLTLTGEDHDDDDEDDSDEEWDVEAVRDRCKESLGRAHEVLTYLELKGASPVLELALWKMKIEGKGEEREQGGPVSEEVRGQDQGETARERKRLKANKDTDRDPQLSRNDCRVKCGVGIVSSEVLRFFAYRTSWPRLDD